MTQFSIIINDVWEWMDYSVRRSRKSVQLSQFRCHPEEKSGLSVDQTSNRETQNGISAEA